MQTTKDAVPTHPAKPKLRGWLHVATFPLAVAAGIVLIALSPTAPARISSSIYAFTAALLFGTSGLYHRGKWSPRVEQNLKRLDHCNIFLITAGTYTPFAVLLLSPERAKILLLVVWGGSLAGVIFKVFWVGAPRWLYTPIYIALGWVAVIYLPDFLETGGLAISTLIVVGGGLYTLGAVIYGIKRPNPIPNWLGFHEIFHVLTVAGFITHYIGLSFTVYRA